MLVSEIYNKHPKTVDENATVKEVISELLIDETNGAIVMNPHGIVTGIISLQDIAAATVPVEMRENISIAHAMFKPGFFSEMCQEIADVPVKKFMREEFMRVDLQTNILAITADFLQNDLYIVPVFEKEKLIGVITRSEIKKAVAKGMGLLPHKTNTGSAVHTGDILSQ
jgi:predicted transcriptional regulator